MTWECSNGHGNGPRVKFCSTCGEDRPNQTAGPAMRRCRVCNQGEAMAFYAGKCSDCGRCHGKTERGRCTFRAEVWEGRGGFCGWHQRVKYDDTANTFLEFEKWQSLLLKSRICDRWTHYLPGALWDGMAGTRERLQMFWCGGGDCAAAPQPPGESGAPLIPGGLKEPPAKPATPVAEVRDSAWRDKVLEQARLLRGGL